ncbi:chitin synthase [Mycena polygramma]|nr:chitin synthase [Mycena polygramma]
MDYRADRPPRQTRPRQSSQSPAPPGYPDRPFLPNEGSRGNVQFRTTEQGDRQAPLDNMRNRSNFQSAYQPAGDLEGGDHDRVLRKKSLVRPDREKIEPGHRQWHYRNQVAQLEQEGQGRINMMPSIRVSMFSRSFASGRTSIETHDSICSPTRVPKQSVPHMRGAPPHYEAPRGCLGTLVQYYAPTRVSIPGRRPPSFPCGDKGPRFSDMRQKPRTIHGESDVSVPMMSFTASIRKKSDSGLFALYLRRLPHATGNYPQRQALRRGQSLLGREEDVHESGLALFKRATLRRKRSSAAAPLNPTPEQAQAQAQAKRDRSCLGDYAPGPKGPWMLYCYLLTFLIPTPMMRACGLKSPEQQRAWREKMGLMSIIASLMAVVGFITFGFTQAVCGTPPNRFHGGAIGDANIGKGSVVINGYDYDFGAFHHPAAGSTFDGTTNPLFVGNWGIAGNDISFMFQKVNQNCLGIITKPNTSQITGKGEAMDWYFPCNVFSQYGTTSPNTTAYNSGTNCHVTVKGQLDTMKPQGQVYYTWDDVRNKSRKLAVFESSVLDLELLDWLDPSQITVPSLFNEMKAPGSTWFNTDMTMTIMRRNQANLGHCLQDMITIGFIDTNSIGCVASQVLLYLSLIFIVGVVLIRFAMAVMFQWFFSQKLGNFPKETYEQRMQRSAEIEAWTNDIYKPAPSGYRPNVSKGGLRKGDKRKTFLPNTSRFTPAEGRAGTHQGENRRPTTAYGPLDSSSSSNYKRSTLYAGSIAPSSKGGSGTPPTDRRASRSLMSWGETGVLGSPVRGTFAENPCPFPLDNVVPQPPADYEPFNFPLAHTICLVTAYSESVEGLRTTLDSLATTDYPNSHKLILIIADGMVKGAGNEQTTPEICLTMMKEFVVPVNEVEAHSYVAIADGHKRHNMAKVYAGYYAYDDATTERSKQQRVPIMLVAKCGNPLEAGESKPGNRGKRDSQIVLMAFLQKVMFDERMTTFEYEFFNSLWRTTGVSPDRYELVLCVDADTKVFPDSLTRMVSCMVHDEEIMGLCGETKIANKAETFVTMMQVFEYYISHHMTKAFESMFGGVTCLPGCFSMYRIKAPKGDSGFWVPILANPDIVEHYSENVVDTLHKKNLLLLGEDRYLTTLMLKTFPKRKNMFCPQAVCKTVVPDTFRILLSQRRRWINSTIHNLFELVLVRDLCGTFCFSMQFVVGMELAGTLVLPAAITFTLYLIIVSIIPHHTNTTVPLVLLAFVLGLPLVLIIVTSRKWAYVGWMLIYLLSLPIWNGILPAYAFWHFDDFSWGATRKIEGDKTDTGDKEGEFDSTHIVMKRWAEFERERRWKNGTQSRDSDEYYNRKCDELLLTDGSRTDSNRYSIASNSDQFHQPADGGSSTIESASGYASPPRGRRDSNTLLMLPQPLAVSRHTTTSATSSASNPMSSSTSVSGARSSEDGYDPGSSAHRLIPSAQSAVVDTWDDSYDAPGPTPPPRPPREPYRASMDQTPPGSANPFITGNSPVMYDEPEMLSPTVRHPNGAGIGAGGGGGGPGGRGVRLTDSGPVPGPEGGVRRVARPSARRPTSQSPVSAGGQGQGAQQTQQNRYSRNSMGFSLPPGAAPPQGYGQ